MAKKISSQNAILVLRLSGLESKRFTLIPGGKRSEYAGVISSDSKTGYSEILTRDSNNDDKGVRYKIRLTAHITNILQSDSTNVKLGLFIANNINVLSQSKIQGRNNDNDDSTLDIVPSTNVLSPKGTILHGNDANISPELRAKFEIFYTEPES